MNSREQAKIGARLRKIHSTIEGVAVAGLGRDDELEDALWELDGIIDELGEE